MDAKRIWFTGGMRYVRSLVALAVLGASLFWSAGAAHACSCVAPDANRDLAFADAAFVGTLEGRTGDERGGEFGREVGYGFAVEEWVKGDGPAEVTIWSSDDGASCGLEVRPGQRVGIFATVRGNELTSGLCSTINANMLLAATSTAVVVGEGPAHFVAAGSFAEGLIAYLDARGRPLGYLVEPEPAGWGRLASCPGGETVVLVRGDSEMEIIELAMGDRRPVELGLDGESGYVTDFACLAPDGSDVVLLIERFTTQSSFVMGRIDPDPRTVGVLPAIRGGQPRLVGDRVVVAESNEAGGRLRVFEPESGATSTVAEIDRDGSGDDFAGYDQPAGSPDGTRVAIVETVFGAAGASNVILVVDLATGDVRRGPTVDGERWGISWLDDEHLGAPTSFDGSASSGFAVIDAESLEEVVMLDRFTAQTATKLGDEIWGTSGSDVQRVSLSEGEVEITHAFAASLFGELLPIAEPIDPPAELSPPSVGGAVEAEPPAPLPPLGADEDVDGPVDVAPAGEEALAEEGDSAGGSPAWIAIALVAGVASVGGGALVFARSRRSHRAPTLD